MPFLLTTFYMLKLYSSTLFSVSTSWYPRKSNCNFFTAPIVFYLLGHFWHTAWLRVKALLFPWGQVIICLYSSIHSVSWPVILLVIYPFINIYHKSIMSYIQLNTFNIEICWFMQNLAHIERFRSCLESGTAKWEQQWQHKLTLWVFILSEILENSRKICLVFFFFFFCSTRNTNSILN